MRWAVGCQGSIHFNRNWLGSKNFSRKIKRGKLKHFFLVSRRHVSTFQMIYLETWNNLIIYFLYRESRLVKIIVSGSTFFLIYWSYLDHKDTMSSIWLIKQRFPFLIDCMIFFTTLSLLFHLTCLDHNLHQLYQLCLCSGS